MSANQVALWYLIASICFILALKGLSHPTTARRGNLGSPGSPQPISVRSPRRYRCLLAR